MVEVLEDVPPDPDVIGALRFLKKEGYLMRALDDYVDDDPRESLAVIADIIKVEMPLTTDAQREKR